MLRPLISTRMARLDDSNDLADIDTKAFEIYWSDQEWYEMLRPTKKDEPRTIIVATYYGNVIGFVVAKVQNGECCIEKLAVREKHRRQGIGCHLFLDMVGRAKDHQLKAISIVVPESLVYPDEHGALCPAIHWAKSMGLKATQPFLRDYFSGYGTFEDGVRFSTPLSYETSEN